MINDIIVWLCFISSLFEQVFAQMEAKIILSRFLRSFDYEVVTDQRPDEFEEGLTLHLRHGLPVKLTNKS